MNSSDNLTLENCKVYIYAEPKLRNSNHSVYFPPEAKPDELYIWKKNTEIRYYLDASFTNKSIKSKELLRKALDAWQYSRIGISFKESDDEYEANVSFIFKDNFEGDGGISGCCEFKPSSVDAFSCYFYSSCFINDDVLYKNILHQIGHMLGLGHIFEYTDTNNSRTLADMSDSIMNFTSSDVISKKYLFFIHFSFFFFKVTKSDLEILYFLYSHEEETIKCLPENSIKEKKLIYQILD